MSSLGRVPHAGPITEFLLFIPFPKWGVCLLQSMHSIGRCFTMPRVKRRIQWNFLGFPSTSSLDGFKRYFTDIFKIGIKAFDLSWWNFRETSFQPNEFSAYRFVALFPPNSWSDITATHMTMHLAPFPTIVLSPTTTLCSVSHFESLFALHLSQFLRILFGPSRIIWD